MDKIKIFLSLYLFLAVILAQFFAAYLFSKGKTSYRKAFSALFLCISLYLFGYLMIINNNSLEEMIFWNQIQYLGLPFISVLWLLVALLYTKTIFSLKMPMGILLFSVPVITFFIRLTNFWHHLFYTKMELRQFFGYYSLYMERGIWYYVNITYTILCMLLTVFIYYIGYLKNKSGYSKSHFLVFLFASLLPFLGIVLILIAFDKISIDYSALIMPVSLLIISYGIIKYDFLELRTLARETIFENNFTGMVVLGPGNKIIDYNKAARMFFKSLNISLNHYPIEHILEGESELLEVFQSTSSCDLSMIIDGEERYFEVDVVQLGDHNGKNTRMLKTIRDVTEEKIMQEKLKYLATTDSLSKLNNRTEFINLAKKEFDWVKSNNQELALLVMDLDNFKAINDTFGHVAGDEVIQEVGCLIKTSFRKTDIAGRLGGEEFAVVLKNTSLEEAKKVAEKFRETVAKRKVVYEGKEISFTLSIGVAAFYGNSDHIKDFEDIFKMADYALYKAKDKGRNLVAVYNPNIEKASDFQL